MPDPNQEMRKINLKGGDGTTIVAITRDKANTSDVMAYADWCAQMSDGEMPPLTFEEWMRERKNPPPSSATG